MNVLLVYPRIPDNTYWSFRYALSFQGKRAAQPPLDLMTVAAMLPASCSKRLVDEGRILASSTGNNTTTQLNFLPRMNTTRLVEGYRSVLRRIYSVDAYYERVSRFLSQCQSGSRPQGRAGLNFSSLRAILSSVFRQGILDRHRRAYWRFVLTAATRYRRSFGAAMTLAVMGYHFQRITDQLCNPRA